MEQSRFDVHIGWEATYAINGGDSGIGRNPLQSGGAQPSKVHAPLFIGDEAQSLGNAPLLPVLITCDGVCCSCYCMFWVSRYCAEHHFCSQIFELISSALCTLCEHTYGGFGFPLIHTIACNLSHRPIEQRSSTNQLDFYGKMTQHAKCFLRMGLKVELFMTCRRGGGADVQGMGIRAGRS